MSHYSIGASIYTHKGKKVTSIVNNPVADKFITETNFENTTKPGLVPTQYKNRPDLIANLFLDKPDSLWYICFISNKYDVFEDFDTGSRIRIPK